MASLCHPWCTTTNLSYWFPIFETSAPALCGTNGISFGFLWYVYGSMGFLLDSCVISIGFPWWFLGISLGFQRDVYGISFGFLSNFYGIPMVFLYFFIGFLRDLHDISIGFLWEFYGINYYWISMECHLGLPWCFYDSSMRLLWDFWTDAMVILWYSYGISIGFLSTVISMVFLW